MTDTTAVMVYQNSQPWLAVALRAIERRDAGAPLRLILVGMPSVDSSPAEAEACAKRAPFPVEHLVVENPPCRDPVKGGGLNHGHGLALAFQRVRTPWTLFLDADTIVLRDGWLRAMHDSGGDIVGPPAFAYLKNPSMPHAHPCLLLFRTALGRPPYWTGDFGLWARAEHPEIDPDDYWDTCVPFTHSVGSRADVRLVRLAMRRERLAGYEFFRLGTPELAIHLRKGSNRKTRGGGQIGPVVVPQKLPLLDLPELKDLYRADD